MNKLIKLIFFFNLLPLTGSQISMAGERFGQYVGVLENKALNQEQLAKLDLISSRQDGNELKLIAILSLYFGDFASSEYVSYHYDNVKYNILTGSLVFDQPDQDLTLVVNKFSDGGFDGILRSSVAGDIGKLLLKRGAKTESTKPLIQPVWGEYRGTCQGVTTALQVQTMRSTDDTSRVGNPFGTYDLKAQLAEVSGAGCLQDSSLCVMHTYDTGTYNYFTGDLQLFGLSKDLECKVSSAGLSCNGCAFTRKSSEATLGNSFAVPYKQDPSSEIFDPANDPPAVEVSEGNVESLSGLYNGYVYHERLGTYQKASLNLVTYQRPRSGNGTSELVLSAVASLYFGSKSPQESLTYKFNEKPYDILSPQIVLDRIDGDTDAIIQMTRLGNGIVKGTWFSMLYGRVGSFELRKGSDIMLPSGAKVMGPVSGKFQSPQWYLDLKVARESTPINTRNPFFPLNFKGFARMPNLTANKKIVGGSYDFYTGKISFMLEDSSLFAGLKTSHDNFLLKRPTPGTFRPLGTHAMQKFRLLEP